ncbi:BTB/POZ domain [Dillenia turbinata]|uniref:BTB/POZ domain n=1 Tax=Dillenia turbinata TaxID=194707 RepID=A0AAN8ZCU3_9MAGN
MSKLKREEPKMAFRSRRAFPSVGRQATDISDLAIARSIDAENALFAASESEGVLFAESVGAFPCRGYKRFFKRSSLESSDYLKDDCLAMHCTVGVVRTRVEGPKQYTISLPPSDMGQSIKYLLDSEVGCDIVFQVGDETFKAHKLILAARSPVFRAQFFGLIGNPNMDKVVIEDVEPSIFKAMLLFIYCDKLPDVHEITGSMSICSSTIMVQHLLAAADRYGLDRLKLLCEAKLCEDVTADTVATTLALAEQHRCSQLKTICLRFAATPENLGGAC